MAQRNGRIKALMVALSFGTAITAGGNVAQAMPGENTSSQQMPAMQAGIGSGPYDVVIETKSSLPDHVIYRPRDLANSGKLGVLVWGNGACSDDGTSAWHQLSEIASYGYLVIAPGKMVQGPNLSPPARPEGGPPLAPDGKLPGPATSSAMVLAGLDWALAENMRDGSDLQGRIDTQALAASGHSCGGLQAIEIASDPRLKTVLIQNSGVFKDGVQRISGINVDKSMLKNFHTPVIYIVGGEEDQATPNGTDDYEKIDHVPAALLSLPVGHGGTFDQPYGGTVAHVVVDWLEWQLRGDDTAGRTFSGENCRLCSGGNWSFERKNFTGLK